MKDLRKIQKEILKLRIARDRQQRGVEKIFDEINLATKWIELEERRSGTLGTTKKSQTLRSEVDQLKKNLKIKEEEYRIAEERVQHVMDRLQVEDPQQVLAHMSDKFPFLLFPVRLETRFYLHPLRPELWVRIFPDDIAIETHETGLLEKENAAGKRYWEQRWRGGKEKKHIEIWRKIVNDFGEKRGAWIVRRMKPLNYPAKDPLRPIPENKPIIPMPFWPINSPKAETWSRPPVVRCMPDRFRVIGYSKDHEGKVVVTETIGKLIPDPLIVGPNPSHPDDDGGFSLMDDRLNWPKEIRWMTDFKEAVQIGMGVKIKLKPPYLNGFDKLVVVGLRLSSNEEEGTQIVESLLNNHHFSETGFSLIPQGMATNNTGTSGLTAKAYQLSPDESHRLELEFPLIKKKYEGWEEKADGQILAEALGINHDILEHIQFSDRQDQAEARAMNIALWPATGGYYMRTLLNPSEEGQGGDNLNFDEGSIKKVQKFFLENVSGRGAIPSIRIDEQPYSILPAMAYRNLKPQSGMKEEDPLRSIMDPMWRIFQNLEQQWNKQKEKVAYVGKPEKDHHEVLMNILGLYPTSSSFVSRIILGEKVLANRLKLQLGDSYAAIGYETLSIDGAKDFYNLGIWEALGIFTTNRLKLPSMALKNLDANVMGLETVIEDLLLSESRPLQGLPPTRQPRRQLTEGKTTFICWLKQTSTT